MRFFLILLLLTPFMGFAQTICPAEDREVLDSKLEDLSVMEAAERTPNQLALEIALMFKNTPYVEKTLEVEGDEPLVINLNGLDCTTYLETVLAFARVSQKGEFTYEAYQQALEYIRYREGKRNHYPSRLHYFSDWIFDNEQKGVLKDITAEIGGIPYENKPTFMSANRQYYKQLSNPEYVAEIKKQEAEIAQRDYYYIPKASLRDHEENIQSGDLIAITISLKSLDISHVGMAIEQNGRIHLLHASTTAKKVVISDKPLAEYLMGNRSQTGVMVCRIQ